MTEFSHTATLGAGVIGARWTALFLASGRSVAVFDPSEGAEKLVRDYVEYAWDVMAQLGLTENGNPDNFIFHTSAATAVKGADSIQESVPERLPIKHALFAEIEPVMSPEAVIASSASGLTLGQMQDGWMNPSHGIGPSFQSAASDPIGRGDGQRKDSRRRAGSRREVL